MQVDVITLVASTIVTGAVGWGVKLLLDTLRKYVADSTKWRSQLDGKVDAIANATQTTMRTTMLHYIEKYMTRGWITPEERASLYDMHRKYSALDANGYIDGYMARIADLPDREI